ncbi:hypothetical protein GCM10019059_11690 [Camelimonas fluminis]|nr:hypothetical protein GCM10019059_11690 [Camelimonas fluminis]
MGPGVAAALAAGFSVFVAMAPTLSDGEATGVGAALAGAAATAGDCVAVAAPDAGAPAPGAFPVAGLPVGDVVAAGAALSFTAGGADVFAAADAFAGVLPALPAAGAAALPALAATGVAGVGSGAFVVAAPGAGSFFREEFVPAGACFSGAGSVLPVLGAFASGLAASAMSQSFRDWSSLHSGAQLEAHHDDDVAAL